MIDIRITELQKWNKQYENQSIITVELFPIKISNEFQWKLPAHLFNSNLSLTATRLDLITIDCLVLILTWVIIAVCILHYQMVKKKTLRFLNSLGLWNIHKNCI